MRVRRRHAAAVLLLASSLLASRAWADQYDSGNSGHPLRIAAYVLHPFGYLLDTLLFRPAHWIGSHEPFSTIFGHEQD